MRKLAIIAISGIVTSAVCISAAAAIGGGGFIDGLDFGAFSDKPACQVIGGVTATSRDLDWDGSDHFGLAVPAQVQYSPTNGPRLHVTGDPQFLAHLQVRDGTVEIDCSPSRSQRAQYRNVVLQMTAPGRSFEKFSIAGSGKILLQKLDQPMLGVSIAGSGSIKADGKVDHAVVHIAGSGDADLGQVNAKVAEVHIAGSGNTDIAPSDEADIHIAGSGDVNLHTNPKRFETHIAGSGRIHNVVSGS